VVLSVVLDIYEIRALKMS